MSLPIWLSTTEYDALPLKKIRRGRADYLEKTLADIQKIMAEDMYQTGTAGHKGFLQGLNPRIKLLGIGLVLAAAVMTRSFTAMLMLHAVLVLLSLASGISLKAYLLRTWLPATLFTGIAVLPGIISWITPGEPLLVIYQGVTWQVGTMVLPAELTITRQGLTAATLVLFRSAASLGLVVLLMKTTRWPVLTKTLGAIGLPWVFVMVLDLAYRYLFLFLLLCTDCLLGRRSRLVGVERIGAKLTWIGGALAGFLRLAGEYSKEITAAMQARGYNGENHQVLADGVGRNDFCFIVIIALMFTGVLGGAQLGRIIGF